MASDAHSQVRELKRKHREKAILSGNPEEAGFFWEKKVERDIKQKKGYQEDDESVRREREAELERVRARRHVPHFNLCSVLEAVSRLSRPLSIILSVLQSPE